jgi:hypothetical protein
MSAQTPACPTGERHNVRMEWETRNGLRTGALSAYCWTCRRVVPPLAIEPLENTKREQPHYIRDYMREWRKKKSA